MEFKFKSIIATYLAVVALALCSCDGEPDNWAKSGCPYKWALDDRGYLYSTNKYLSREDFMQFVNGHFWELSEFREIDTDLKGFSKANTMEGMLGNAVYIYFDENVQIAIGPTYPSYFQVTDAKYSYTTTPIDNRDEYNHISYGSSTLLGMRDHKHLELANTMLTPNGIEYQYEVYTRRDDLDINEMMKSSIEDDKLSELWREWLWQQHLQDLEK